MKAKKAAVSSQITSLEGPNNEVDKALKGLEAFPTRLYEGINLNWIALYAVSALEDQGVDLSFENIVVAAFRLFPKKFSLLGFPEYPDAKRIHDALWRCAYKNRQWLMGKTSQGFAFTQRGRQELELAKQALKRNAAPQKRILRDNRRFEKLLAEVMTSPAYAKYSQGIQNKISEAECCHVLQGTLDSERRILLDNLNKLKDMAIRLEHKDVVAFLDWLEARFAHFLGKEENYGKVQHTG